MAGAAAAPAARPARRGSYNCGRCGLPKRGHVCAAASGDGVGDGARTPAPSPAPHPPRADLRRALSFDSPAPLSPARPAGFDNDRVAWEEDDAVVDVGARVLPMRCLMKVMEGLPPWGVVAAASVSRGWHECVRRVWKEAEELRIRVPPRMAGCVVSAAIGKCRGLLRLHLQMESNFDATMLACIAFSCPNLEALEINMAGGTVNQLTGDELGRFVSEKRSLSVLKVEGCNNLGFLNLNSSYLSTLWLSDLHCVSKVVLNCPNLDELSLDFTRRNDDNTDLVRMMDSLARSCPKLSKLNVASLHLCNEAVLALEGANLRGLRMLSLVLGSRITDAAVASIIRSHTGLELLDLSGSSISDNGIGMICNAYSNTLTRLLLAICPRVTSSGIQFAVAQLPLLELIDCGMSISVSPQGQQGDLSPKGTKETKLRQKPTNSKHQQAFQKLIVKHENLKKISLWGCSGLDALYLNCPGLDDLNLNSCTNLNPERLLLQCPNLKNVHVSGCQDMLVGAIRNQVLNEFSAAEAVLPCKRAADGSKRVKAPVFLELQPPEEEQWAAEKRSKCNIHLG